MELIDSTDTTLTVSWPDVRGAQRYVLQYRKDTSSDEIVYETLSEKLSTTQARKRNLPSGGSFFFRAGAIKSDDETEPKTWVTHSEAFTVLTEEQEKARMAPPTMQVAGNEALKVSWKSSGDGGYELQLRENVGGASWKTIAETLAGTEVRKKNLTSKKGYMFRVRPAGTDTAFSAASAVAVGGVQSEGMKRIFSMLEDGKLLNYRKALVPAAEAVAGKEFVLLYASAGWCGPCRQFTPQLMKWYQQERDSVEVVFLSADHDQNGFDSYYKYMPWAAVPFDDDGRDKLMSYIKVTGIPRLVVLDGKTGRTIVDNAVGQPLDINRWRNSGSKKYGDI